MRPSQPETSNLPGNYPGRRSTKGKIPSRNPKKPRKKPRESGGSYSLVWVMTTGRLCMDNTDAPTKDATEWPPQTATDAWTNITAVKAASTSTGRSTEAPAPQQTYLWKIQLNMNRMTRPNPNRQDRVHIRQPYSRHPYRIPGTWSLTFAAKYNSPSNINVQRTTVLSENEPVPVSLFLKKTQRK